VFDISPEKLLFLLIIALTVLGPERIPHVARSLGKARSEIRRLTSGVHPDAMQALRNPRGALLDAVTEPRRAVAEALSEPRLALADAIADFKLAGTTAAPILEQSSMPPAGESLVLPVVPADPSLN
jgi:Sec-independent protein translocase protein TatA